MGKGYNSIKRKVIKRDGFLYKSYTSDLLLDSKKDIDSRISLINSFDCKRYKAITPTKITFENNVLKYKQPLYIKVIKDSFTKKDFYPLIEALEYFNTIGFIHGDLNKKNIIYTKDGFKIIDFEPSLFQLKNGIKQLMITLPYVFKINLKRNNLTHCVDKLSFFYFVLRVTGKFGVKDIVSLSKKLNHNKYINLNENKFCKLNYMKIFELAESVRGL